MAFNSISGGRDQLEALAVKAVFKPGPLEPEDLARIDRLKPVQGHLSIVISTTDSTQGEQLTLHQSNEVLS